VSDVAGQVRVDDAIDAQAQARRRAALVQIRQYGDPALRLRAHEVDVFDEELARLVERMVALMADARGVGLAGNQVGILRRVAVIRPDEEEPALALVNPRIVERSELTAVDDEGCLSLQGVLVPVARAVAVTVEAQDVTGRPVRHELGAPAARVVQHEIDHLDGVLIVDRASGDARREALAILRPRTVIAS
jgi:peptide deformylase